MGEFYKKEQSCRVDFWKESGKWYSTKLIIFREADFNGGSVHQALINGLKDTVKDGMTGMRVTCLEPYHVNSHPISLMWKG